MNEPVMNDVTQVRPMKGIFNLNFKIKVTISLFDLTIALFDSALEDTIK